MNDTLESLFYQAEDYFTKGISKKFLELRDGVTLYMTGADEANLNFVCIRKSVPSLATVLKQSKRFFDKHKLPFVVVIPEDIATDEMKDDLKSIGYLQTSTGVAMWARLEDVTTDIVPSFNDDVVIHDNNKKLNEWMMPLITAFKSNFEVTSQWASAHENALKKGIKLHNFSLYALGQPACSITLSLHNNLARIDNVGTLPALQNRGYATYLIKHALLAAKKFGATHCFLESSESGFSLYQKLGFKPLFKHNFYSIKE